MAKLVTLKRQSGEAVYPITVTAAVMDSEGNPAEVVFAKKQDTVSAKSSDQGVEVKISGTLASPTVKVNVTSSGITSDNSSVAIASDVFNYAAKNEVFKGAKEATSSSVAEAGKVGLVPAPASGSTAKYLKSDGSWSDVDAAKLGGKPISHFMRSMSHVEMDSVSTNDFTIPGAVRIEANNTDLPGTGHLMDYGNVLVVRGKTPSNTYADTLAQLIFSWQKNVVYLRTGNTSTDVDGVMNRAWSRFVLGDDTIKTTYDTDKGVKVELSGTFDEPKIDVTTTFGDVKISNLSNAVSGETIAKSVPLLVGVSGTIIPADSDLNNTRFCTVGTYSCLSDANAKTLTNCPVKNAFVMFVSAPGYNTPVSSAWANVIRRIVTCAGDEWIQQIYTTNTAEISFVMWRRVLRADTTFTKATTSTAIGTQVVNAGTGGAVPAPQTLADNDKFLRGNGTWSAIPTSSVGSGISLPATGSAVHEALTGSTYINTISTDFIDNLFTAKG